MSADFLRILGVKKAPVAVNGEAATEANAPLRKDGLPRFSPVGLEDDLAALYAVALLNWHGDRVVAAAQGIEFTMQPPNLGVIRQRLAGPGISF